MQSVVIGSICAVWVGTVLRVRVYPDLSRDAFERIQPNLVTRGQTGSARPGMIDRVPLVK